MAIIDAASAAALVEATAPFTPYCEFRIEPVVSIDEGVPIFVKTRTSGEIPSAEQARISDSGATLLGPERHPFSPGR